MKTTSLFAILQDPRARALSPAAKLALTYLRWREGTNGVAWPGVDTIAQDLGLDERHCRRLLRDIEAAGCIGKTSAGAGGRGNSNRYSVVIGKGGQETPVSGDERGAGNPPLENVKGGKSDTKGGRITPRRNRSNQKKSMRTAHTPFTPPTVDEVQAYAESRGHPEFDAEYFVEHYTTADWRTIAGNPVRNWKLKVVWWIKEDETRKKDAGEPVQDGYSRFGTHPATEEEIEALQRAGVL